MNRTRLMTSALIAALALAAGPALADDLFTATVTSNGVTSTASYNTAKQVLDQFKNGQLNQLIPSYTSTSIADGVVNFRGLTMQADYASAGTTLRFQVPSIGIDQSFTGTTRDISQRMLVDYLKKSGAYGSIMRALAASSPVDPVAGNPSSLQSRMVAQGFDCAFATNPGASGSAGRSANSASVGLAYGHFSQSNTSVNSYTLPLGYSFALAGDSGYRLAVDLPITYLDTEGAQTGAVSLGIGLTIPLTAHWSITPRISAGATGSLDLASAAALGSGSVTSAYRMDIAGYGVVVGNMLGYSKSIDIRFGDYSFDPKLHETFTKNGLMVAIPTAKFGFDVPLLPQSELQMFVTDTRFFGTKLYEDNFQEIGASIGSSKYVYFGQDLRIGVTYIHGAHSHGVLGNLGFHF